MSQRHLRETSSSRKSKLLRTIVKNLENYEHLRQVGAALPAGVRGLDHAHPPHLLNAATLAYEAWDSLTQATIANCWLKSDILPLLHTVQIRQDTGRYHQQNDASSITDLCTMLRNTTVQSLNVDASSTTPQLVQQQMLGDLESLCLQSHNDPDSLTTVLEEWFTIEDSEIIRQDEAEMLLEGEQQHTTNDLGSQHSNDDVLEGECDLQADSYTGESDEESSQEMEQSRQEECGPG